MIYGQAATISYLKATEMAQAIQRRMHQNKLYFDAEALRITQQTLRDFIEVLSAGMIIDSANSQEVLEGYREDVDMKIFMKMAEELALKSNYVTRTEESEDKTRGTISRVKYLLALRA